MSDEFRDAVWLLASYVDKTDDDLPEVFRVLRETCPTMFDKILLLAHVLTHHRTRFEAAGLADAGPILRDFETTADVETDAQRFLQLMEKADMAAEKEALLQAVDGLNPYRLAAIRLLRKFRQPNLEEMTREIHVAMTSC